MMVAVLALLMEEEVLVYQVDVAVQTVDIVNVVKTDDTALG